MQYQGKSKREIQEQIDVALSRYSDKSDVVLVREVLDRIDSQKGANPFAWAALDLLEALIANPEETDVRDGLLRALVSDDLQAGGVSDTRAACYRLHSQRLN